MEEIETDHPMYKKISEGEKIKVYQSKGLKDNFLIKASQESGLGKLGLDSFIEKGIVGPPYNISDLPVNFYYSKKFDSSINVSLYDMDITIGENDKNYKNYEKIKDYLENLVK